MVTLQDRTGIERRLAASPYFRYAKSGVESHVNRRYYSVVPGPNHLRIGTSSFTANGWRGAFYPKGLPEREYLRYYATKFNTVEVDSTFYRTPSKSTVQ